MKNEVLVVRKGQITIPIELRRKYNIEEGTRLEVTDTKEGILLKRVKSISDLAGADAGCATPEEMKKLLDELREEDA